MRGGTTVLKIYVQGTVGLGCCRQILEGVASYAHELPEPWDLRWARPLPTPETVRRERYDGVLVFDFGGTDLDPLRKARVPMVRLSSFSDSEGIARVISDNREIGRMAAAHFQERLHRNFAFVGSATQGFSRERCEAFSNALGDAEVAVFSVAPRTTGPAYTEPPLLEFLKRLPAGCAIFCANDGYALRVVRACMSLGLRVPGDRAVLGVDNDTQIVLGCPVMLSSIDSRFDEVGRLAAARLHRIMNGERDDHHTDRVAPAGVILRRSTDRLATDDEVVDRAVRWMRASTGSRLKVEALCTRLGMGRRAFERRFRKVLDRTPEAEMRRLRLERGADLLARTQLPIEEIAVRAGFTDRFHFSAAFRGSTGLSPRAWRNAPPDQRTAPGKV